MLSLLPGSAGPESLAQLDRVVLFRGRYHYGPAGLGHWVLTARTPAGLVGLGYLVLTARTSAGLVYISGVGVVQCGGDYYHRMLASNVTGYTQ